MSSIILKNMIISLIALTLILKAIGTDWRQISNSAASTPRRQWNLTSSTYKSMKIQEDYSPGTELRKTNIRL